MSGNQALPEHLAQLTAQGLCNESPIAQYELGSGRNFVYLLLDWVEKRAAIIDPQSDLEGMLQDLEENGFTLEQILLTHTHYDHIAGLPRLMSHQASLIIRVGEQDLHRLSADAKRDPRVQILSDGEEFEVGHLKVRAFHTPGHSAGEFCYFVPLQESVDRPYLFTGDTIFIRDCGRTDFQDGSDEAMFHSIQRIKALPPETVLLVGHHYARECATTLESEMRDSPPFCCRTIEELADL